MGRLGGGDVVAVDDFVDAVGIIWVKTVEGIANHALVHVAGLHDRVADGDLRGEFCISNESATGSSVAGGVKGTVEDAVGESVALPICLPRDCPHRGCSYGCHRR